MQGKQVHISDDELLLFSDQELPTRHATAVREHIAQCEPCRRRLIALEVASASFADLLEQEVRQQPAPSPHSRDLLKARLAQASSRNPKSQPVVFRTSITRHLASACLALLLVVGVTWGVRRIAFERSDATAEALALPRRALTPGITRIVLTQDLCATQDLDNDPPVNPSIEQAVFKEYGLPVSARKDYALDYLISPALGGVDNIRNLWPQPSSSTWNARVKDQLENHLHDLVCQGKLQLTTAQNDISSDWIAAYKRYFNTDKPELGSNAGLANGLTASADIDQGQGLKPRPRREARSRASAALNLALIAPSWRPFAMSAMLPRTQ